MSDFYYENRHKLNVGDICLLEDGSIVKLDRRVPGDGTDWYVLDYTKSYHDGRWYYSDEDNRIHPSDIKAIGIDQNDDSHY